MSALIEFVTLCLMVGLVIAVLSPEGLRIKINEREIHLKIGDKK